MNLGMRCGQRTNGVVGRGCGLRPAWQVRRCTAKRSQRNTLPPTLAAEQNVLEGQQSSWKHVMVALIDSNPMLGTDSRLALSTAAGLAMAEGKLTVIFLDETPCTGNESRMTRVKNELEALGLRDVQILEEEIGDSAGGKQQSVAVGEAADTFHADLVVMSTSCVHEKHVDANLLAEFVPAPLLLLP